MPYIISVLILIIIGVGFTLFKTAPSTEFVDVIETIDTEVAIETGVEIETNETQIATENEPDISESTLELQTTTISSNKYQNGTYTEQTSYRTPEGNYQMSVTLTIENDQINNSTIAFDSKGAESNYSKSFVASYKQEVLQKDIAEVSLSRVGGASLTTKAFNAVLESVKNQASS